MDKYLLETLDKKFPGAVCHYYSIVSHINSLNSRNFTLRILDEALLTNPIVFYFAKNFYLVDAINEKISQF